VRAFYCDHFVLPLPAEHTFPMSKYHLTRQRVLAERILAPGDLQEAEAAPWDAILRVHDAGYVDDVRAGRLSREAQRRIGFPWSPEMVERSRRSVGATLQASRAALADRGRMAANLAGGTHHAFRDRGEGFCVFNDVAVAIRDLQASGRARRIAILDCDVHQGNGSAAIFSGDHEVFTCSVHGEHNYPFRKETSDLDIALPDDVEDADYLEALAPAVSAVLRHAPDLVFYLAGADPFERDRWGRMKLTFDGLRRRDELALGACWSAGIPVAITMAGGYAPDVADIVRIHSQTLEVAARLADSRAVAGVVPA
jgi:acetoin utilization deacetylase AcuC-like enzyme